MWGKFHSHDICSVMVNRLLETNRHSVYTALGTSPEDSGMRRTLLPPPRTGFALTARPPAPLSTHYASRKQAPGE